MIRNLVKAQSHNDGTVRLYSVGNISTPPLMPKEGLTHKASLRYKERTVGMQRYYTALQANVRVSYVLRCPLRRDISAQDVAIPNDGKQYRIVQVQYPEDISPPVMDLTLEELVQNYDIA